jgi:hypothetical protein
VRERKVNAALFSLILTFSLWEKEPIVTSAQQLQNILEKGLSGYFALISFAVSR